MGYLDDYVNNATKLRVKKPLKCIPTLLSLIQSNQFDYSNPRHIRMKNIGVKYGYIDEDLNILKGA